MWLFYGKSLPLFFRFSRFYHPSVFLLVFSLLFYPGLTFCSSINHGEDLVIPEAIYLKSLGRANARTDSAPMTFDFIVGDFAFLVDIRRIKRTNSQAAQTGHAQIFSMLGDDT